MGIPLRILICLCFLLAEYVSGQCPDRDSVWNRTLSIRNSTSTNYKDKLKELLLYEDQIRRCPNPVDSVYTFLLLSIGVLYYRTADYNQAVQYTKQALEIIQSNADNPGIKKSYLIQYYFYLSIYYDSLNLASRQNEAVDSVITKELRLNSDYTYSYFVLETNVINLYERGEYGPCADRATLGETLVHKYFRYSDSMDHIIFFIYYKANSLRLLKMYPEEEQFLESKKTEFLKSKNIDYVGLIYSLFGYLYESTGEYTKAIKYFRKALYYDDFSKQNKDIGAIASNAIGLIYAEKLDQYRLALQYYDKALSHAQFKTLANGTVSDSFYILGNVANVYVRLNLFDSAFYFFQQAFDKIKKGINESDLESDIENYVNANTVHAVLKLVMDKAYAHVLQYYYYRNPLSLKTALTIYKTTDRLLARIKEGQDEIQSRLFWQEDTHSLYEHAVEAAFLQNNYREAFYFFEKSRAVLLDEQLNRQSKTNDADLLKQAHLKRQILLLERERDLTDVSSNKYIEIQKEIILNKQALVRFVLGMKNANPLNFASNGDTSFVSIEEVQNFLKKSGQKMLEIFSGDSAVYSLLITEKEILFDKINKKEFDSAIRFIHCFYFKSVLAEQAVWRLCPYSKSFIQDSFPKSSYFQRTTDHFAGWTNFSLRGIGKQYRHLCSRLAYPGSGG